MGEVGEHVREFGGGRDDVVIIEEAGDGFVFAVLRVSEAS